MNPLDILLELTIIIPRRLMNNQLSSRFLVDKFAMIAELIELLFLHGAKTTIANKKSFYRYGALKFRTNCPGVITIFRNAARLLKMYDQRDISHEEYLFGEQDNFDSCDAMMDIMGDMFRSFVLANTAANRLEPLTNGGLDVETFTRIFVRIAGYSSQPGRSKKLIELVLNALSAAQVIRFRGLLLTRLLRLEWVTAFMVPEVILSSTRSALEWFQEVETPFRLQHLARLAVNHAMIGRGPRDFSTLGLPHPLLQYLLLKSI